MNKGKSKGKPSTALPRPHETDDIPPYDQFEELVDGEFEVLVEDYRVAHEAETEAKEEKKRIAAKLEPYLVMAEVDKVLCGGLVVVRCYGHGPSSINKQFLLEAGVPADVLAEAVVPGKPYTYIQVRRPEDSNG